MATGSLVLRTHSYYFLFKPWTILVRLLHLVPGLLILFPYVISKFVFKKSTKHLFLMTVKHIPSWLPGTTFQQTAKEWTKTTIQATEVIYNWSKGEIVSMTSKRSLQMITFIRSKGLALSQMFVLQSLHNIVVS